MGEALSKRPEEVGSCSGEGPGGRGSWESPDLQVQLTQRTQQRAACQEKMLVAVPEVMLSGKRGHCQHATSRMQSLVQLSSSGCPQGQDK